MSEYIVELYEPYDAGYRIGEEIVRCRDCKYYEEYVGSCTRRRHCFAVKPGGFCAWGERRGE